MIALVTRHAFPDREAIPEVTPEMVEAGEVVLAIACDQLECPEIMAVQVRDIYIAMERARLRQKVKP